MKQVQLSSSQLLSNGSKGKWCKDFRFSSGEAENLHFYCNQPIWKWWFKLVLESLCRPNKDPPSTHTHTHLHSHMWFTYTYTHTYITYILWGQGAEAHSGWLHIGCKCWVYICSNIVKVEFHRGKWGKKRVQIGPGSSKLDLESGSRFMADLETSAEGDLKLFQN